MASAPHFELYKDSSGEFRFRLRGGNGRILIYATEGYVTRAGARSGIASVKANAPLDARYRRRDDVQGRPYFVLIAANGEELARSETYSSRGECEDAIEHVKRDAPSAPTQEL